MVGRNFDRNISCSLIRAVRNGKMEKTKKLINSFGLSYSPQWSQGYVLLVLALQKGHSDIAKLLLSNGSKVTKKNQNPCDTPLHIAIEKGYIDIVEMLLEMGAKIEAKNKLGQTPLYCAINQNNFEVTKLLLNIGADVNVSDNDGFSLIHLAVKEGCLRILKHLIKRGAYVNSVVTNGCKKGYTPLHMSIENGYQKLSTLLINNNADINFKGENNITPLHIASMKGCTHIVQDLLNHGACTDSTTLKQGYTPLMIAINSRNETVVQLLLEHITNIDSQDKDGCTILNLAVKSQSLGIVKDVLKHCPDINNQSNKTSVKTAVLGHSYKKESINIVHALLEYGLTLNLEDTNEPNLLHTAVKKGYVKIVEYLLKHGFDANTFQSITDKETPLHSAAKNKQEEVAKLLISNGADINAQDNDGNTPIYYATYIGDIKTTKLLLNNRANVNPEVLNNAVKSNQIDIVKAILQYDTDIVYQNNKCKTTALHLIRYEDPDMNTAVDIAKLLLNKGANVDALNETNHTPLYLSACAGNNKVVKIFLNKGADIHKYCSRLTALHISIAKGHTKVVELLLKYGAKFDSKSDHFTPLHLCADFGYDKIIKTILNFGADINSKDNNGKTALHIASENGHLEVVRLLLRYGSDINITTKSNQTALNYAIKMSIDKRRDFSDEGYYGDNDYNEEISDYYRYWIKDSGSLPKTETARRTAKRAIICRFELIIKALAYHIIKMETLNLYVSNENLNTARPFELDYFLNECKKEISRMKSEIINANISLYDILTKDINSLEILMRNENIVQVLKSDEYETKFPIYTCMIKNNFRKSLERSKLIELNKTVWHLLFKKYPQLPHICTEKIFSFLDNEDLKTLINLQPSRSHVAYYSFIKEQNNIFFS